MYLGLTSYDAFHTLVAGHIRGYLAASYLNAERFGRHVIGHRRRVCGAAPLCNHWFQVKTECIAVSGDVDTLLVY